MEKTISWSKIKELRDIYCEDGGTRKQGLYWQDDYELLDSYHKTLAQRIKWKWQYVLQDSKLTEFVNESSQSLRIVDFGCGTGVATDAFCELLGGTDRSISEIILIDESRAALKYSSNRLHELSNGVHIKTFQDFSDVKAQENDVLLISHVINELSEEVLVAFVAWALQFPRIVWVEPGAQSSSRRLGTVREPFLKSHNILAPCNHQNSCPAVSAQEERDWCHFFAQVPAEAHTTAFWREFANICHIDLSRLPLSYLVMTKSKKTTNRNYEPIIGLARVYKAQAKALVCDEGEFKERIVEKRRDKDLFKTLKKGKPVRALPKQS